MKSMSEVKAFLFNYELPAIQQSANPRHDTYFDGSEHKPLDFYIILYIWIRPISTAGDNRSF